jgi:intracellular sulfur oxidation DsrE/DsrF family protein
MRFRSLTTLLMLVALTIFAITLPCRAQAANHRVVLDVSTVLYDGWAQAIVNAESLLTTFGPAHVQIEVVVRGPGLAMLMKSDTEFADRLSALAHRGVQFAVCGETLASSRSGPHDLFPFAVVVDSGVAELVRRQESGWSYIKTAY